MTTHGMRSAATRSILYELFTWHRMQGKFHCQFEQFSAVSPPQFISYETDSSIRLDYNPLHVCLVDGSWGNNMKDKAGNMHGNLMNYLKKAEYRVSNQHRLRLKSRKPLYIRVLVISLKDYKSMYLHVGIQGNNFKKNLCF